VSDEFREFLLQALALASLGTVADVVPLTGENRIITHHGLRMLQDLRNPGLEALRKAACENVAVLKSHHVAFRLGPRLNAAGRLGEADRALELLITDDRRRARELAAELDKENERRRRIEQKILKQARESARAHLERGAACIVLAHDEWHIGVVGIAAARLAEETERPVVLIALDGEEGRGSGRSYGGVPLHEALEACASLMEDFGGHSEACGVRVRRDRVDRLSERLNEAVERLAPGGPLPFAADMVLPPHHVTGAVLAEIERLAPFGQGNEPPLFIADDVPIVGEPQRMGRNGDHLSFLCRSGPYTLRSVYFGGAADGKRADSATVSFAYEPFVNSYSGVDEIELRVRKMF
jgi:single-stranded-DNA-specific exonuclease